MNTSKQEFQRAKAETVKGIRRATEDSLRKDLIRRLKMLNKAHDQGDYKHYSDSIAKKYTVSIEKIEDWAKDIYIAFKGDKSVLESVNIAFDIEETTRNQAILRYRESDEYISYALADSIRKEFFNGNEVISLEEAKNFFFPTDASKEVQGKRVRDKDDLFDRLLHCAFAVLCMEDFYYEEISGGEVRFCFYYELLFHNSEERRRFIFNSERVKEIKSVIKDGICAKDFHRLLCAFLYEWSDYCKLNKKPKTPSKTTKTTSEPTKKRKKK